MRKAYQIFIPNYQIVPSAKVIDRLLYQITDKYQIFILNLVPSAKVINRTNNYLK